VNREVEYARCGASLDRGNLAVADGIEPRTTEQKTRVFISYSRKDMSFADRLEAALKTRGFDVLIDRQEIYAFEDWWKRIEALIGRADTVVFVLSPDAVKSNVALKEIACAMSMNKRFAPIVCRHVEDAAVPDALRRLNFIFFDDPEHFEASADRLADALETDINWIRQHTQYGETERRWAAEGRPNGLLLQSPTLEQAEYWLDSRPRNAPEPTTEIRSYVIASRKRARSSQRIWRLALASTFTFMAATIVVLVGWMNQDYLIAQWRWWTVTRPYAKVQVWPYVLSAAREKALKAGDAFKECAQDCPEMVVVPAGSFTMGAVADEGPQHPVTISKQFAVSKYELTFDEWDACFAVGDCKWHPSDAGWGRGRQPVIYVNWDDAQQYVAWLAKVTGKPYRLLSESEYEYAARGGTQTAYPWGDEITLNDKAMANCNDCGFWGIFGSRQAEPVGTFPANGFGLFDMVGNVFAWVEDCYQAGYVGAPQDGAAWTGGDCDRRVIRGGSWASSRTYVRSAGRSGTTPEHRGNTNGFRVARTLDTP
jgi:formylglycine-generating enzyme required for sulfatase activity